MDFICIECLETFEHPREYIETHGLESPPYEVSYGCPYCGGNYTEVHKCDECGHDIDGPYIKLMSGERICENCYTTYELGEED